MWRPKDWGEEKPQVKDGDWSSTSQVFMMGYNQGVEAGADAMYKALALELYWDESEEVIDGNNKDED